MFESVDFVRKKYFTFKKFDNTSILRHLNRVSIICLSLEDDNLIFEKIIFTDLIINNVEKNGIMNKKIIVHSGDHLCRIIFKNGVEKMISSEINGELIEINLNVTSTFDNYGLSWIAILNNSEY